LTTPATTVLPSFLPSFRPSFLPSFLPSVLPSVPAIEITPSLAGGVIKVPSNVSAIILAADIILDGENSKQQCHVQDNCHNCESQFTPF
jgi:hypothetical protein